MLCLPKTRLFASMLSMDYPGEPFFSIFNTTNTFLFLFFHSYFDFSLSLSLRYANSKNRPYIKWFLDNCGHTGLNKMLDGFEDRTAYAQTIVAYTTGPNAEIHVFDGRTDGKIVTARGPTDFGWDPVFEPNEGHGKTYAEMSKDFKNTISHRGRSFEKFRAFLHESSKS